MTDISVSSLTAEGLRYTKYSLPYQFDEVINTENYAVSVWVRGNYLNVKSSALDVGSLGQFRARWDIWSASLDPQIDLPPE